jgi:transposase-like protein
VRFRPADQGRRPPVRTLQRQRRLGEAEVLELVQRYVAGETVVMLARAFGLHRTTVLEHLELRGVPRRQVTAKLSPSQVDKAAELYRAGSSLKVLAADFDVAAETMRRTMVLAGVSMRPKGRPRTSR